MWNPSAFIKWQEYCRHYEYNQRLSEWIALARSTFDDFPAPGIEWTYPDYDVVRAWRSPRG